MVEKGLEHGSDEMDAGDLVIVDGFDNAARILLGAGIEHADAGADEISSVEFRYRDVEGDRCLLHYHIVGRVGVAVLQP